MKVGLWRSLGNALLKGCLWMSEKGGDPGGGQDEASKRSGAKAQKRMWH